MRCKTVRKQIDLSQYKRMRETGLLSKLEVNSVKMYINCNILRLLFTTFAGIVSGYYTEMLVTQSRTWIYSISLGLLISNPAVWKDVSLSREKRV